VNIYDKAKNYAGDLYEKRNDDPEPPLPKKRKALQQKRDNNLIACGSWFIGLVFVFCLMMNKTFFVFDQWWWVIIGLLVTSGLYAICAKKFGDYWRALRDINPELQAICQVELEYYHDIYSDTYRHH
jgi:hypothetical protein